MWKLILPFLLLLGALGLTVATDRPAPPADFTFINRGDVNTLDLHRMSWMQDLRVAGMLFEGLVVNDVFSHELKKKPGVAERWEVSPDFTVFTFHLRRDAKWSNGEPVTAADFLWSWRRAILPDVSGDYINFYAHIAGVQEFFDWRQARLDEFARVHAPADRARAATELWEETKRQFDRLVQVRAPDPYTLVVTLRRPVPYFLDLIAFEVMYPVYPPLVQQYQTIDPETGRVVFQSDWTRPPLLVSNGPYRLTTWRFKRDMRLEANEHYWNRPAVAFRSIAIPSVNDPNATVLAYTSGGIDWLSDVVPDYRGDLYEAKLGFYREHQAEYDRLVAEGHDSIAIDRRLPPDPRKNIHVMPATSCYFYSFNCKPLLADGRPNPFHRAIVRKAFALATEKTTIVSSIRRIGETPARTLIPPGSMPGYTSPAGLPYDPDQARKLLAEAGYPNGEGFPPVHILFNRDGGHDLIAQSIAKSWQSNLGVKVVLDQREIKVFRNDLKGQNYMVARGGWFGDYNDPTTFLDLSRTGDGNNDRAFSNPAFDALLDAAENESDPAKRLSILSEAERMLVEDELPMIPIFRQSLVMMFDADRVSGLTPHPLQKQKLGLLDLLGDGRGADRALEMPLRPRSGASN
jgi:oligopeptide transport system substrate-binding protein